MPRRSIIINDTCAKSPCLKCDKRYVGCHSGCGEYKKYRDILDGKITARKEFQKSDRDMHDYLIDKKTDSARYISRCRKRGRLC